MRHARIQQAKPERSFAERIVAVIVAIAMLGGMGYATTSAAMADGAGQTSEQQAGISLGLHDYDRSAINNNHALKFKNAGPEDFAKAINVDLSTIYRELKRNSGSRNHYNWETAEANARRKIARPYGSPRQRG